jgi:calcineurin-like phosphoesterase
MIGLDISSRLERFVNGIQCKLFIAHEDLRLDGCIVEFNRGTNRPLGLGHLLPLNFSLEIRGAIQVYIKDVRLSAITRLS